jgi:hypothetical protein
MRTTMRMSVSLAFAVLAAMPTSAQENADKVETKQIAEEAFIYGFPLVMNYAVFYDYFIDRSAAGYKAPLNTLYNSANVYTPADKTIVTPNSDTPYSFVGMDLRAEPLVICNPELRSRGVSRCSSSTSTPSTSGTWVAVPRAMAPLAA